jgi:phage gp45-like
MGRNDPLEGFAQIVTGKQNRPPSKPQVRGPQEGRIVAVDTGSNTATFVIKEYDQEVHRFGPAPYGRTDTPPVAGDRCLVVFVGGDINRGWIVCSTPPS